MFSSVFRGYGLTGKAGRQNERENGVVEQKRGWLRKKGLVEKKRGWLRKKGLVEKNWAGNAG